MSRFEGPQGIVTNGLVLNLDAGDPDSYTRSQPPFVEVLVVAGGGSGGGSTAGGGGAGGLIYNSALQLTNAAAITVTVGAGGAGVAQTTVGNNGSNSVFGSLTAIGGGGGGMTNGSGGAIGRNGGSGGGGAHYTSINFGTPGTGTPGQGNNGGNGSTGNQNSFPSGGGGGAGAVGGDATNSKSGNGGNGSTFSISGTSTTYAGGGGGGSSSNGGNGGTGGGAAGTSNGTAGGTATANTGGGGGGGWFYSGGSGGAGGSGIVIVRYPGLPAATGGTIAYINGFTIHTFTTSGTFTPNLWNDVSGTNNSTLINGPTFNSFQNGGFIAFDGVDDHSTSYSVPAVLQGNPNLTVCGFFRRTEASMIQGGVWGIGGETTDRGINCWNFNNSNEITIDTWNRSTFTTGVTFPLNEWVFVAWQKIAGDMTRANCIVWRNLTSYTGTQLTILRAEGPAPNINNYGITLGSISRTLAYTVGMQVGKFWVYNRVLSVAEITQNYNETKARFGF